MRRTLAVVSVLAVLTVACGNDDATVTDATTTSSPTDSSTTTLDGTDGDAERTDTGNLPDLPPHLEADMAAVFDPMLEPMGLRFARGSLIDLERRIYQSIADGTHLAVYVEPTGDYTDADYVEGIVTVSKVFLPMVFDRWPGLKSFDVCQEPHPDEDDSPSPPGVTLLDVTREQSETVDWPAMSLADLVELGEQGAFTRFFVDPRLEAHPDYPGARD